MLIIKDVRVQPGDSAFLLDDGKTAILYDTGFGFTGFGVADNIKKHLGERPLDYIFLTHSHYDHALGSAYILRRYPDAKVVAGEYAAKIFAKPTAKAVMWDLDRKFATKCGACDYENLADELRVDIAVSDGDEISAGDMTFRVLNLPGHTKCSVGYYLAAEQLLLSCETIGVFDGKEEVAPSYLVGYAMAIESIERVE
ncbi:MAG: MBL fold metallo-hydrolase, partial [Clostridia bacterium]|nr:MBL fold metallo-hydrolase [Clostridia bacterium]